MILLKIHWDLSDHFNAPPYTWGTLHFCSTQEPWANMTANHDDEIHFVELFISF